MEWRKRKGKGKGMIKGDVLCKTHREELEGSVRELLGRMGGV